MLGSLAFIGFEIILLVILRNSFLESMTNEESVLNEARPLLFFLAINVWFETFRALIRGFIRALDLQHLTIWPSIISQWFANPLLIWYFAFELKFGLHGIWIAKIISEVYVDAAYYLIVHTTNFEEIIRQSKERIIKDGQKL